MGEGALIGRSAGRALRSCDPGAVDAIELTKEELDSRLVSSAELVPPVDAAGTQGQPVVAAPVR